jgi:hypothetical protein
MERLSFSESDFNASELAESALIRSLDELGALSDLTIG